MGFSNFRDLMNLWDDFKHNENTSNEINSLIDGQGLILFFEKDKDVFGADENNRIVFAKLKDPDDDLPKGWTDEATFSAQNLTKTLKGEASQQVFGEKDLKELSVIDRDDASKKLTKIKGSKDAKAKFQLISFEPDKDRDQAPNFIQAKEKE